MRRSTKIAAVSSSCHTHVGRVRQRRQRSETATRATAARPPRPAKTSAKTADGDGPKIGLAYDVGGRGDQSFNDSAYAGVTKVVEDLDATCEEAEANAGENDADREERLRLLAERGYNPIIAVGFVYSPAVDTVAAELPRASASRSSTATPRGRRTPPT